MALQWTLLPIVVELDCLQALRFIQSKEVVLSELAFLVREVKLLMAGNRDIMFMKIHRDQNSVSHALANKGRREALTAFWPDDTCTFISHLLGVESE